MRALMLAAILAVGAVPGSASALTPTETVKAFYDHPGLESDPSARDSFIDPALTKLNQNDAIRNSGQGGCLDPGLALDNGETDPAEVAASLKLAEAIKGDEAKVIAAFTVAREPHRMEWKLRDVAGQWKVYDLISVTGEWALSQFGCE